MQPTTSLSHRAPLRAPVDPHPVHPCHAQPVDRAHFLVEWSPAGPADRYRLQIAATPDFQSQLFEHEVPHPVTSVALRSTRPTSRGTYYWRVLAGNERGWSRGDRVESLTLGAAEDFNLFPDPDAAEPLGPLAPLFKVTALQAYAEAVPGPQPAVEAFLGEKPEGVEAAQVLELNLFLLVAIGLLGAAALLVLVTFLS